MSTFSAPPFRLTCVAALLILSGQTSALPEPKQPENNYNWNNDNLVVNSVYALGDRKSVV